MLRAALLLALAWAAGVAQAQPGEPASWPPQTSPDAVLQPDPARRNVFVIDFDRPGMAASQRARILDQLSMTSEVGARFFSDRTRLSFAPGHGTQVSYGAPDGRMFLWYPGNVVVLPGQWAIRPRTIELLEHGRVLRTASDPDICFRYGPSTYNPATGKAGGDWECARVRTLQRFHREARPGDVFGLSRRAAVPYILPRDPTTIAALLERVSPPDGRRGDRSSRGLPR